MAAAKESHQFTDRNSSYLDHMAFPHLDKDFNLPYFPPCKCTADAALLGQYASDLPSLNTDQQNAVGGFQKLLPPHCNVADTTGGLYLKDSLCESHQTVEKPVPASFAPSQRRFLIFDQSENHTRLFFSPSFSPLDQIFASKTNVVSARGSFEKVAAQVDQHTSKKPIVEEKWDENHLSDGEGEMLEDSEEIDALLYSNSDDDEDDEDGGNDEVTSTRRSASFSLEEGYKRDKLVDELTEEVASSDESELPKRQKLLDGEYKKLSLESSGRPMNPGSYKDDVESSCGGKRRAHDYDDDGSSKRATGAKMREALKMLEGIVPGLEEKDPLSIIDGAVAYLKAMKTEAERLGLSSTTSSRNHRV